MSGALSMDSMLWSVDQKPPRSAELSRESCTRHSDFLAPSQSGVEEGHRQVVFSLVSNLYIMLLFLGKNSGTRGRMLSSSFIRHVFPYVFPYG